MKTAKQKLKKVKIELKQLNRKEFQGVADNVKEIRIKLQAIQLRMRDSEQVHSNSVLEKDLKMQWNLIEEGAMQQKSRVQWLKLGDDNTVYFFAHVKNRKLQNTILNLSTSDGTTVFSQAAIGKRLLTSIKDY